jgi:hypothetical protein
MFHFAIFLDISDGSKLIKLQPEGNLRSRAQMTEDYAKELRKVHFKMGA